MIKKVFDKIARYKHLFNPAATLVYKGESGGIHDRLAAPVGSWKLSDDPKTNLALWNAIFVGGATAPLAYLINTLANKKHEAEVDEKFDKALVDKLNALRPRLVSGNKLGDVSAFSDMPKQELKQLDALIEKIDKKASVEKKAEDKETLDDAISEKISTFLGDVAKSSLPFLAIPAAGLSAIGLSNYINKQRIKAKLNKERMAVRNIQSLLDRKHLQLAGLIKADQAKPEISDNIAKQASTESEKSKKEKEPNKENSIYTYGISTPALAWSLVATALGLGYFSLLRKNDKNLGKIKHLKKVQLGSNVLQDTPKISVLDLPATTDEILAVPGDKQQRTLTEAETKQTKELPNKAPKALLENKELFTEVLPAASKKDALF